MRLVFVSGGRFQAETYAPSGDQPLAVCVPGQKGRQEPLVTSSNRDNELGKSEER